MPMETTDYGTVPQLRIPPHSIEIEQSLLGGLLLDNGAWSAANEVVGEADLYRHDHRLIFAAIGRLVNSGQQADVITVCEQLERVGSADDCGGRKYLFSLTQSVPSSAGVRRYAEIVHEYSVRRSLVAASDEIASAAFNPGTRSAAEIVARAQTVLAEVADAAADLGTPVPACLDLRRLAGESPPPRQAFRDDWLYSGATLLPAKGGEGKSSLSQHEATCGALGRPYFASGGSAYRSLVWNAEDDHDEMWRRESRICEYEDVDMASLAGRLHLVSRYGCENALMAEVQRSLVSTRLFDELRQQVNDLGIDVLWLDNVAHMFLGNHDDRTQVTQFINRLNGMVRGRPFGVVLVAHVSRAQGSEFSGSVAWENAARMRWYLGSRLPDQPPSDDIVGANPNVRFLAKRKSNYTSRDYVRMTMRNGLLVPDEPAGSHVGGIVSALDEKRAEELCIAGFRTLCEMGIRTTDGKTSPDYLPVQMTQKGLVAGYSKSEIGKAMNRLMGRGVFRRDVIGKHTNRSDKFGLVLNEEQV